MQLFNGTVYRWNRPCYGIGNGKPHLRIECRVIPSGPTVVDEVGAMAIRYVTGSSDEGSHQVVIVPQNEAQMAEARSMAPEAEATVVRGGTVFSVGRFFSAKYADMVCETYVAKGFFTTRIEL